MAAEDGGTADLSTSDNERAARVGFAQKRVVWFGGPDAWWEDWIFFLENEHTLVSMWRGHALHPFDRTDRMIYFVCVLCFSLFMSAYVQSEHPLSEGAVDYCGWVTLSSLLLVAYDYMLRFIATSPCMQPGGSLHAKCWLCRDCCIDCGKQGLYICLAGSFAFLVVGIVLGATAENVNPEAFFITFIAIKLLNFIAEIGPHAYAFYTRRERQRENWFDGVSGGAYPLGPTFPDPLFVRESRHDGETHRWPDEQQRAQRRNPLFDSNRGPLSEKERAQAKERRQKQIEMLQRARDKVRAAERHDPVESLGSRSSL